jgi:putative oxidoreductase
MTKFENEIDMDTSTNDSPWAKAAVLTARLILALVFLMAFAFKVMDINTTAGFIASAGFPFSTLLAIVAAVFEFAIVLSLVTGAYFSEMMLLGAIYVVFLAFAFHGPSHWIDDKGLEFGGFISHFPFAAGMLFAAAHGPGRLLALKRNFISRKSSINR